MESPDCWMEEEVDEDKLLQNDDTKRSSNSKAVARCCKRNKKEHIVQQQNRTTRFGSWRATGETPRPFLALRRAVVSSAAYQWSVTRTKKYYNLNPSPPSNMVNGLKLVNGPFAALLTTRISFKQLNANRADETSHLPLTIQADTRVLPHYCAPPSSASQLTLI